jgi:hypothetical protein
MQVVANVNESILSSIGASIPDVSPSAVFSSCSDYKVIHRDVAKVGFEQANLVLATAKHLKDSRTLEYALDPYRRRACIE